MAVAANNQTMNGTSARFGAAGRPVWQVAGAASLAGIAVAGAYEAIVRAAGVSLDMGTSKAEAEAIPVGGFVGFTAMFAAVGFLFALAVARWANRPGRTYAVAAWAVVAVSLALPFLPAYAATETRVVLALAHVAVAAVVVPPVARHLARRR
jgi:hypothetical protein